jgi:hypothetical protein
MAARVDAATGAGAGAGVHFSPDRPCPRWPSEHKRLPGAYLAEVGRRGAVWRVVHPREGRLAPRAALCVAGAGAGRTGSGAEGAVAGATDRPTAPPRATHRRRAGQTTPRPGRHRPRMPRASVAYPPDGTEAKVQPAAQGRRLQAALHLRRAEPHRDCPYLTGVCAEIGLRVVGVGDGVGSRLHCGGSWGRVGDTHGHALRNPGGRAPPTQPPGFRFRPSA